MSKFEKFATSEEAAKYAEECGFEVIHGSEKVLLLDIDSGEDFVKFERNRDLVDQMFGVEDYTVWNSQSSKHHVLLKLKQPLSLEMRLFLQACLGSDLKRELLTYKRVMQGEKEPIMLFRPKKWGNKWKNPQPTGITASEARSYGRRSTLTQSVASPRTQPPPEWVREYHFTDGAVSQVESTPARQPAASPAPDVAVPESLEYRVIADQLDEFGNPIIGVARR